MDCHTPSPLAEISISPLTKRLEAEVLRLASTPKTTVSITGELGVGKQTWARRLHAASARRDGAFVVLAAGEALGPEVLERAIGGTLYLADATSLDHEQQDALDLLLSGHLDTVPADPGIRVIAASREDLGLAMEEGRLREDLEYRLNVLTLDVPPLRERVEEILPYAEHFLGAYAARLRLPMPDLAPDARAALLAHRWPGNLYELESVLNGAFFGSNGTNVVVTSATLGLMGLNLAGEDLILAPTPGTSSLSLDALEEDAVRRALAASSGNRSLAARQLGIHRTTLYHKMRRFGIR
ncbi:MAG: two-component system nitrogen regulation response regulator NtrX [Bacteroidia bacterium]|jgi:two-component system nitrogen regulation response regulator NtrX